MEDEGRATPGWCPPTDEDVIATDGVELPAKTGDCEKTQEKRSMLRTGTRKNGLQTRTDQVRSTAETSVEAPLASLAYWGAHVAQSTGRRICRDL